jgi:hypothetical protein
MIRMISSYKSVFTVKKMKSEIRIYTAASNLPVLEVLYLVQYLEVPGTCTIYGTWYSVSVYCTVVPEIGNTDTVPGTVLYKYRTGAGSTGTSTCQVRTVDGTVQVPSS